MFKYSARLLTSLIITFLFLGTLESQILNGSFEEWGITSDSSEYPLYWDAVQENQNPLSLTKSDNSFNGLYSVNLKSLNYIGTSFGPTPAYIGTKFRPLENHYKLTAYYRIDSIINTGHAVVEVFQISNQGHYTQVLSKSYNEIAPYFIKIETEINLPNLDTVFIGLEAKNHETPTGYDGFISVLFDDVKIEKISPNFNIGTRWTYEVFEGPLPIRISYQTFQITDTAQLQEKSVFIIENDYDNQVEYMHLDGPRVYFWDNPTNTFQLTYDFDLDSSFVAYWKGVCHSDSGDAIVNIDSMTSFLLGSDSLEVQHISIQNNGSIDEDLKTGVYKNIGLKEEGLRLPLGYGFCDFLRSIGQLRCFKNDSVSYNFVGYACDSIWFSLPTTNLQDISQIIYPNPTSGLIRITDLDLDVPYELYNDQGMKVQSAVSKNGQIRINQPGIFILRLLLKSKWVTRRIVVI